MKEKRVIIALNDMIKDTKPNKKLSNIVIELFQRGRRLNIWLVFVSQS